VRRVVAAVGVADASPVEEDALELRCLAAAWRPWAARRRAARCRRAASGDRDGAAVWTGVLGVEIVVPGPASVALDAFGGALTGEAGLGDAGLTVTVSPAAARASAGCMAPAVLALPWREGCGEEEPPASA
jgi:hypothetical protein